MDKEEKRLREVLAECERLHHAAWSALTHPVRSVLLEGAQELKHNEVATREARERALAAVLEYRKNKGVDTIRRRMRTPPG